MIDPAGSDQDMTRNTMTQLTKSVIPTLAKAGTPTFTELETT